ncbi:MULTISPECIES: hypothetical protein [unclassified Lysobacter]|uniref:hypothetical protein n=1 Tax=unclassified Lysobacter TaxID=2635362 RepID=UPI001BE75332|nr:MULTISPECIES: hypothetical protein [unclassified Lysobacter]MBT2745275.1 hypothetical protein [Lysobacter sp. ISL-42]MBT2751872.1 hypothetical protein [Lysobacter sp. ISL-50]MBT2777837.1 hypothetical protein [Lysobacter sp. ISL-54]MBT2783093.1 hypothetical protein [Lysobacter sp. ISL-52]
MKRVFDRGNPLGLADKSVFAPVRSRSNGLSSPAGEGGAPASMPACHQDNRKRILMNAKRFLPLAMLSTLALAPLSSACAHDDPIVNRAETDLTSNYEGLYTQRLERLASGESKETHWVIANNALDCNNVVLQRLSQGWDYPDDLKTQDLCPASRGAISEMTGVAAIGSPGSGTAGPSEIWIGEIVRKPEPGDTLAQAKAWVVSNSKTGVEYFLTSDQMSGKWRYDARPEDYVSFGGMTGLVLRSTRTQGTLMVDHRQIGQ